MIMAEKITELRKKNGWSQEELAEKLNVSRQAVSKWESAQSVPDMNRVLLMSEVFNVSTDYLLKDELGDAPQGDAPLPEEAGKPMRSVSMEEAQAYLGYREKASRRISLGVLMCILSPVALLLLIGAEETGRLALSDVQAAGLGLIPLFLLVGGAVALFVASGIAGKPFEYLTKECFETAYGVSGMVRERREREHGAFTAQLVTGIVLCVLSAAPIFVAMLLPGGETEADEDFKFIAATAALLCIVACGVWLIVRSVIRRGGCDVLLEEGEYSRGSKEAQQKTQALSTVYWSLVTAGYLAYSFITMRWDRSWIVWPVAGVLYGVVLAVYGSVKKH